jgi:hypothetical protein
MQDICQKAESCASLELTSRQTSCYERRVHQEKLANTITPSAGGNGEAVTNTSVREPFPFKPTLPHSIEGKYRTNYFIF